MAQYSVQIVKVFENELPGPAEFMCSRWDEWLENHFYLVIARNAEKTIVINSGPPRDLTLPSQFQREFAERSVPRRTEDQIMPTPLREIGIEAADVDVLILTPLTYYTTGNLSLFTEAEIFVLRRGWIDFLAPEPHSPRLPKEMFVPDDQLTWLVTEGWHQLRLLDDEDEILPGIRTWFAGAHHRSTLAVEIDTEDGTVVYTDAFFRFANLEENVPIGVCEDQQEAFRTYARVRECATTVLPALDPRVFELYPDGKVL